jgi:radical SAM protein with 4Fe4S-binding SPASM domain
MAVFIHSGYKNQAKHLYLEVTSKCNFSCPHCSPLSWKPESKTLDFISISQLLDDFYRHGGRYLTISGGEPGIRQDLADILLCATDLGFTFTLYTNGLAVRGDVLECMKTATTGKLAISIDGPDAETHEQMRGKGSFNYAISRLEKAIDYLGGDKVMISCVLNKPILPHLEKFIRFVRSYKVSVLYIGFFEPLYGNKMHDLAPSTQEMISAVLYLLESFDGVTAPQLLFSESFDLIKTSIPFSVRSDEKITGSTIKVQPDGWAYPGPYFYDSRFRIGRPMEQGWESVQQSAVFEEILDQAWQRVKTVPQCRDCFWSARCASGSIAFTWALYGNFEKPCPLCELYKATLERATRIYLKNESNTHTTKN